MKKLMLISLCILVIVFSLSAQTTWTVDDDGGADFTSIKDAMLAVNNGDVILVYPGTYYEEIVIDKSVTIKSTDGANVTIVDAMATTYGRPFMVIAPFVTIEGFMIKAGHEYCCNKGIPIMIGAIFPGDSRYLGDAHHVTIKDNIMTDSWTGIYVWKSSDNLITGNTIYDVFWRAVQVYDGSSNAQIQQGYPSKNNKIIDNEIYDSWGGLYVGAWNGDPDPDRTENSGTIIQDNYLHDLTDFAICFGYTDSADVDISGNTMNNNPQGITVFWWGITNLTDTIVTGNTSDSNTYGILIGTCNKWTIENNEITNSYVGIYIMESKGIEAHRNNIVGNTWGAYNAIGSGDPDEWELDAELNYWGSPTGPSRQLPNGKWVGKGNAVSGNVDFKPWLPHPVEFWKGRF